MAHPSEPHEAVTEKSSPGVEKFADRPLNLYSDQIPDMKPKLRKLDLQWLADTAAKNIGLLAAAALVGGAVGLLLKRKYTMASLFVAGVMVEQMLSSRRLMQGSTQSLPPGERERKEMELERYAMKAQLGDYGKIEVIPFR